MSVLPSISRLHFGLTEGLELAEIGECSFCPRAVPQTWGTILDGKNGPPHPPRTTRGRAFRFALPLDPIPQRPREGDCGPPPLGFLPRPFSFGLSAFGPYFVTALGPPCPEGCYEVHPSGQKSEIGRPRVGFQRVGSADPALWSLKGRVQRGKESKLSLSGPSFPPLSSQRKRCPRRGPSEKPTEKGSPRRKSAGGPLWAVAQTLTGNPPRLPSAGGSSAPPQWP